MATTTIRNLAVILANENKREGRLRSIYNSIAHALEPYFGPGNLDLLAVESRSKITEREKASLARIFMELILFSADSDSTNEPQAIQSQTK